MVEIQQNNPLAMCPMVSMCKGIAEKPPSLLLLMAPGLILIVIGVLIVLEPKILIWLTAGAAILLGFSLLMIATWVRRMAKQFRSTHG